MSYTYEEAKLMKVSKGKRPTSKSIKNLEREIYAQVESNRATRERSYVKIISLRRH